MISFLIFLQIFIVILNFVVKTSAQAGAFACQEGTNTTSGQVRFFSISVVEGFVVVMSGQLNLFEKKLDSLDQVCCFFFPISWLARSSR